MSGRARRQGARCCVRYGAEGQVLDAGVARHHGRPRVGHAQEGQLFRSDPTATGLRQMAPNSTEYHYHLGVVLVAARQKGKGRGQFQAAPQSAGALRSKSAREFLAGSSVGALGDENDKFSASRFSCFGIDAKRSIFPYLRWQDLIPYVK